MDGCLKAIGRLGCLLAIVIAAGVAYWFRAPIMHTASRYLGPHSTRLPPVSDTSVGAPTPGAVRAVAAKLASLGAPGGPDSVVLTPNEMASLIGGGIDWTVRKGFDSLRVELMDGSIAVDARLDTRVLPRVAVGPAARVVVTFVRSRAELVERYGEQLPSLAGAKAVWYLYPKGNKADINRDGVAAEARAFGWRGVSNLAVDDVWSAIRVRPLKEGEE